MGKHRAVKRLGALLAVPVFVIAIPVGFFIATHDAAAAGNPTVAVSSGPTCNTGTGVITVSYLVTPAAPDDNWGTATPDPSAANVGGFPAGTTTSSPITVTVTLPAGYGGSTTSLTVTVEDPDEPGTPYSGSSGNISLPSCPVPPEPPGPPGTPTASNLTTSSVTLNWAAPTSGGPVATYQVERCTGSSCSNFSAVGPQINSPTRTFTNTNLAASTTYRYRVRATGAGGTSGPSGVRNVTTAAPPTSASPQPPPPPPPPPVSTPPLTTSPPLTTPPTSTLGDSSGTGGAVAGGGGGGGSTPSLVMLGGTAGILFAFLIALVFLVRERRLLREEAEDDDDDDSGYWRDYRTELR